MSRGTVAVAEDEEVTEAGFWIRDSTEGWINEVLVAELDPVTKDRLLGLPGFGGGRLGSGLQRSAEITAERNSGGIKRSCQGFGCG